jgi:Putative zinc-finger
MAVRKRRRDVFTNKTCKQMTTLVFDYVNDNLSANVRRDFLQHLRICPDCVSFLNTYNKTASEIRSIRPEEFPLKIRNNILDFLRGRSRKSGTNP